VPFLDTTVFIDMRRKASDARKRAVDEALLRLSAPGSPAVTCRFNVAELLVGVELSKDPIRERQKVDESLDNVTVLDFDEDAAHRYAKFAAHLRRLGRPVGALDLLVASVAVGTGSPVLTRNPRHFSDIPGLAVEAY
jgi:predicted nucleic acid-binding protein